MTRRLYHLGRWCSERGPLVLVLWLVALALVTIADQRLPAPPAQAFVLEGTNSAQAQRVLNQAFPGTAAPAAPLVVADEAGLTGPAQRGLLEGIAEQVRQVPDVNLVVTPAQDPSLLSADGTTAILSIVVDERSSGGDAIGESIQTAAEQAAAGRAEVALGGYLGASISQVDTKRAEALGLAAAVVILLLTLRRGWPVAIPLATALVSVGIGLAAVGLLERVTFVPDEAAILGTMLGLGVGIDYALFLVTRHRALLLRGFSVPDAAGRTVGTAGAGMVFAGGTLIAAVSGLALTGISFLMWLGFAAALIVAVAVLAALTLVPALFGILGLRVLPKRWAEEVAAGAPRATMDAHLDHSGWARLSDSVTRRPWRYAVGSTTFLAMLALPVLTLTFGQTDGRSLPPDSPAYRATVLIADGFGPGRNGPFVVVGQLFEPAALPPGDGGPGDPRTRDPRLVAFGEDLAAAAGVAEVSAPVVSTDGGVAVWVAIPTTGPADPATEALVHTMRAEVLPQASAGRAMTASLGGVTPAVVDLNERVAERLLPFILGVVALSFLLLMVAYRSLVIPAKAAAMNLISIAAAYGVVVAVFQWGWGASAIGLDGPIAIQSFVPMMMFAVLFGLSMDYEVFLLTSFNEHWQRTGDMRTAVRRGLADTGQVVTSAAAIMVLIFASFILTDSGVAKMFGVGLATAVLVDATIVRCLLVPALMVLAAKYTWWLPARLDRVLPHLHVEGDPAALQSIHQPPERPAGDPRRPAVGLLAAGTGAAVGTAAGAAVDPSAGPAVLLAAAAAAGCLWVPAMVPGAGRGALVRTAALLLGILLAAVALALVNALVAPVDRTMAAAAAAMVGLAALVAAAVPPARRRALPFMLGALVFAASVALGGWPDPAAPATAVVLRDAFVAVGLAAAGTTLAHRAFTTIARPAPAAPAGAAGGGAERAAPGPRAADVDGVLV